MRQEEGSQGDNRGDNGGDNGDGSFDSCDWARTIRMPEESRE